MNMASLTEVKPNPNIPALASGDTAKVKVKVSEGEKERAQTFQGVVIRIRNSADGGSFTVRRVAYGVGVERTFLFQSPLIEKVEVVRHGKVRRAKLYYLRGLSAKAARIKEKREEKEDNQAEIEPEPKEEEVQEQ
jgi:large subunit ribosomal protein L19